MDNVTARANTTGAVDFSSSNLQLATIDLAYTLGVLAFVIVILRTVLRRLNHEPWTADDYVMFAAMGLLATITASIPVVVLNDTSSTTDEAQLRPDDVYRIRLSSKFMLIDRPLYLSYIWTMKLCISIFFARLTTYTKESCVIKVTYCILGVTWLVCMLIFFLECMPTDKLWGVLNEVADCRIDIAFVMGITDVGTTLLIMVLPIPMIKRLKLKRHTLIAIGAIYMLGTFASAVPIVRMIFALDENSQEIDVLIWRVLQCFVSVIISSTVDLCTNAHVIETIVANLPVMYGLYQHALSHIRIGKFGKHDCAVPEFTLALDHAETEPLDSEATVDSIRNRSRDPAGNSLRRLKDKARSSVIRLGEIRATVVVVQESSPGKLEGGDDDIHIVGNGTAAPIEHITTEIVSDSVMVSKQSMLLWQKIVRHRTKDY